MSAGIDYGMGTTNRDAKTGIRYGVISANSIMPECLDCVDFDYGDPACPKCGNIVFDATEDDSEDVDENGNDVDHPQYGHGCADFFCSTCRHTLDSGDCYGDEPNGWSLTEDGYQLTSCLDNAVFVLASPYYTKAQFCSPCVPGAGNLDSADEDGIETYCLGHDWFEGNKAPYPVYSVATRELVEPAL